jgi:hypothetical protein
LLTEEKVLVHIAEMHLHMAWPEVHSAFLAFPTVFFGLGSIL